MKLEQPFKGFYRISQHFGENFNSWYKEDGNLGHNGLDFACPEGTPIISSTNGTVVYISTDIKRGEGVSIISDDIFQWKGQNCVFSCSYWHLKDRTIKVKVGDKVKIGDLLGLSNNTGMSTGNHLHMSIAPIAPDGSKRLLDDNNGYRGYIDPLPYLNLELPLDTLKMKNIKELQKFLNQYGANLIIDGKYGKLSMKALNNFVNI